MRQTKPTATKRKASKAARPHEYERLKAHYIANNPGATPAEYTEAMRSFARKRGT